MFIDPNNRSLGTQSCVHGYTYLVQDNEWNIIAEVRKKKENSRFCCCFLQLFNCAIYFTIQVSLAIRGGYVPEKSSTAKTKTAILSLI